MLSQAEEIVALRRATNETKAMVEERFPFVVKVGANDDFASFGWPAAAAGLLARGVAIMDTTAALAEEGRLADAQVSLRVMLEHSVVFCWIAIDPETNLVEWRRWDDFRRLKIHNDEQSQGFREDDVRTFRGPYGAVCRRSSALVHPTQERMERHMELTDAGIVIGPN